jgi:hypothetical protein
LRHSLESIAKGGYKIPDLSTERQISMHGINKRAQTMNNDFTAFCHIESAMDKYIRNIRAMNKATAYEYHFRLTNFENFRLEDYNINCKDGVKDV